jgi:hypothetical protein
VEGLEVPDEFHNVGDRIQRLENDGRRVHVSQLDIREKELAVDAFMEERTSEERYRYRNKRRKGNFGVFDNEVEVEKVAMHIDEASAHVTRQRILILPLHPSHPFRVNELCQPMPLYQL